MLNLGCGDNGRSWGRSRHRERIIESE
jgi:hypothetical protein